jgi:hypothetical protein
MCQAIALSGGRAGEEARLVERYHTLGCAYA